MVRALVALGSNLGDRTVLLTAAVSGLGALGRVVARSSLYETPPLGPPQPDFLNAVVLLETARTPEELLAGLLSIERALGRERGERWGPRRIDLDLVAYGEVVLATDTLVLPHPGAASRAFVLVPAAELAPDWLLPGFGTVSSLRDALPESARASMRRLGTRP